MNSKQRGSILIPYEMVRENPQYVFDIFQRIGFLPVDTLWKLDCGMILYTGYSAKFPTAYDIHQPPIVSVWVTVREPGVVQDAGITLKDDCEFGDWKLPETATANV